MKKFLKTWAVVAGYASAVVLGSVAVIAIVVLGGVAVIAISVFVGSGIEHPLIRLCVSFVCVVFLVSGIASALFNWAKQQAAQSGKEGAE